MVQGATDALAFTEGMDEADFLADLRTQRAVVMSLMILGEAASRVLADHPEFTEAHPGIPWRGMRGMRNRIAHGYFDIDLHVVWQTVRSELPSLIKGWRLPGPDQRHCRVKGQGKRMCFPALAAAALLQPYQLVSTDPSYFLSMKAFTSAL